MNPDIYVSAGRHLESFGKVWNQKLLLVSLIVSSISRLSPSPLKWLPSPLLVGNKVFCLRRWNHMAYRCGAGGTSSILNTGHSRCDMLGTTLPTAQGTLAAKLILPSKRLEGFPQQELPYRKETQRAGQDGRGVGHGACFLPQIYQKYIYMWNDSHRTFIEHILNAGRRPQTSKNGKKPSTLLGRAKWKRKREKRKNGISMRPVLLRGSCEKGKESLSGEAT